MASYRRLSRRHFALQERTVTFQNNSQMITSWFVCASLLLLHWPVLLCPQGWFDLLCLQSWFDLLCPQGWFDLLCLQGWFDLLCPQGWFDLLCLQGWFDLLCPQCWYVHHYFYCIDRSFCAHRVCDLSNNKRRIQLSTAQKETQITPLHARIPLCLVRRAVVSHFFSIP